MNSYMYIKITRMSGSHDQQNIQCNVRGKTYVVISEYNVSLYVDKTCEYGYNAILVKQQGLHYIYKTIYNILIIFM